MVYSISWGRFKPRQRMWMILIGLFALLLCGCQPGSQVRPDPLFSHGLPDLPALPDEPETLGIYEMAQALNLKVVGTNPTFFTLKNDHDNVMIFTYDGAQFYVNGKPCGKVGPVEIVDQSTRFNRNLVDRIQPYLSQAPMIAQRPSRRAVVNRGTIVIDPGHGGHDPGTTSVLGYEEKTINLKVARILASMLQDQGFHVVMTRNSDVYPTLEERAAIANRVGADLFVSIHADSNPSPEINGFTVFVAREASRK